MGAWGPTVDISDVGDFAGTPQVATDGTTITAVWDRYNGTHTIIEAASSTNAGATWSAAAAPLSELGHNANSSQVVTNGTVITAVWSLFKDSSYRIQAAYSTTGGLTWSPPEDLSVLGSSALSPVLVTDGSTVTAVWYREAGGGFDVEARSSDDGGVTWNPTSSVSSAPAGVTARDPHVTTDGTTITVVWTELDGTNQTIESASSTNGGDSWTAASAPLSDASENSTEPKVVTDGTRITAIWTGFDGADHRVRSAFSTDGGINWSVPEELSVAGNSTPRARVVTNGAVITATWAQFDGSTTVIQSSRSINGGASWSSPATLSEPGNNATNPEMASDGTTITVTWSRSDDDGYPRIQTASSVDGGDTWSTPVTLSGPLAEGFSARVVTDGNTITAVWVLYDEDGDNEVIQSSSFSREAVAEDPAAPELADTGATETATLGALTLALIVGGSLVVAYSARRQAHAAASAAQGMGH